MKMLFHCTRFHISIFILFSLHQTCYAQHRSFPSMEEFIMEEGETLIIQYLFTMMPLKFVYPNALGRSIDTSKNRISYEMEDTVYNFTRRNTVFGDTGWYGCTRRYLNNNVETQSYDFLPISDSEMDWLYVYVRSDTNLFVDAHINVQLSAIVGGNIVIPCRTTWPNLKPKLIYGNKYELNDVSFDPKIGFTIRNLSLEDSNTYECSIEKNGTVHAVSYLLSVSILPEPKIQVNDLFITRGENLKINCTVEMKLSMVPKFDWNMPQQNNSRRSSQQFIEHLDGNTVQVTSQLTILNVADEDEGNYECILRWNDYIKKIRRNIKIYDPEIKRIKFLPEFDSLHFRRKRSTNFELTIYVFAFLDTYIEWLDDNFFMDPYYFIDTKITVCYDSNGLNSSYIKTVTSFEVTHLEFNNSSTYIMQARNDYTTEMMNFTLEVIDKPESMYITKFEISYPFEESTIFQCSVYSNPPPKITWSFLKCPNYPSLENSTIVHPTDAIQGVSNGRHESLINMFIEVSGKITCEACNDQGCISVTEDYINPKAKSKSPFFVYTNMNKTKVTTVDVITEGNNTVILQCFVDGMSQPTVTWYKDNMLLKHNYQYNFEHDYQELHIKYMNLQDSGNYSCRANNEFGTNETYQQIVVKNTKWFTLDIVLLISIPIVGFILAILAISFSIKIYRKKKMRRNLMEVDLMNFEEGALQCLNPHLTVDDQAKLLPYDKKWELPRDQLILKEQLGSGHFGMVFKAETIGIRKNEDITTVAVKMVHRTTDITYIRALANELKIMVHLGKHLNIVNLLGAFTKNISKCELLVIVEYCRFGNLHDYLLKHRNDFINQINPETGKHDFTIGKNILTRTDNVNNDNSLKSDINMITHSNPETNSNSSKANSSSDCALSGSSSQSELRPNNYNDNKDHNLKPICTKDLLSWAFQVARGMEYLSQRKILHGDLAARNILLAADNIVKICDFGFAKIMYDGNYEKKSKISVPTKWMAIESIKDGIFSTQSDVWSFGIMLWEFFTLAETPYPGMEEKKQYQKLVEGYRMEQPAYAVDEIYNIMLQCWTAKPTIRPSFTDLAESIGSVLEESVKMHYINLNNSYVDINAIDFKNGQNDYLMMMCAPDHAVLSLPNYKCENSLYLNETSDSSELHKNSDRPMDESKIFIPHSDDSNIEDPSPILDSEDAIDLPMLKDEEDPYLKPINVHERRAEFMRQRQAMKNQMVDSLVDRTSIYCNARPNFLDKAE